MSNNPGDMGQNSCGRKENRKAYAVTTANAELLHFRQEYRRKRAGVMR